MSAKITKIMGEIKELSVVELAELVKMLEEEFGVSASAMAAPAVAPAASGAAEAEVEKCEFTVTLKEIGSDKIKVIKALRAVISTLSLKDAKEKTESAPCVLVEAAAKDDAKKIKEALEGAGAKVELS